MDSQSLKKNTVSGIFWKLAERVGAQAISLIVSIVLARLLTPDDYSVVGVVTIFFAFANVLITSGFNTALIQKKDADLEDYSSVLYLTLIMSAVMYVILFFTAPYIANLYELPVLIPVIRVMGLTLIINGVKSILCAYISNNLKFKMFFLSTVGGTVFSAIIGIAMALGGFGPWALVAQQMTNSIMGTIILLFTTKIKFVLVFSFKKVKGLFDYGWKILVTSLISTIYDEVNPLIIGIKFTAADLSFYTKGKSFPSIISNSINDTLCAVLFPVISKLQDDINAVLSCTRRFLKVSTYLVFPLMIGFLSVSDSFVRVVLTEKWMPASIYIKLFCLTLMLNIIHNGNLQAIRAIGRSDVILKLEIIKKTLYMCVIVAFIVYANRPEMLALAMVVNAFIALFINTYPNRKLIGYSYRLQIKDILPNIVLSAIMGVSVYAMSYLNCNLALLMVLQVLAGALIYLIGSIISKNESFFYLLNYVKSMKNKV